MLVSDKFSLPPCLKSLYQNCKENLDSFKVLLKP